MKKKWMASAGIALATLGMSLAPTAMAGTDKANAGHTIIRHDELLPSSGSTVRGTATLTLNSKTKQLTVLVGASSLAPSSTQIVSIQKGQNGPVLYHLNPLVATAKKVAAVTTTVHNVKAIGPGWYITISGSNHTVLAAGTVK